jgi:hypothetical protein
VILEVGQTVLKIDGMQSQLVRVRLQWKKGKVLHL